MTGKRGKGFVFGGFKIPVGTEDKYPKETLKAIIDTLEGIQKTQKDHRDVGTTPQQRWAIDKKLKDLEEAIAYYKSIYNKG